MIRFFIILLLFINTINCSKAQFDKNHFIYFTSEMNIGNYFGVDLNMNYVYKNTYSFKIGYTGNIRKHKLQPDDYTSGVVGFLLFGTENPYDQMENYLFAIGKIYNLNKYGTVRINLSIGLGYTTIREPYNWEKIDHPHHGENYSWKYKRYNTISLIINSKVEFPFTKSFGFTISPMIQVNEDKIYIGIGIGQMIGLLRKVEN